VLAGFLDALDGKVARLSGASSQFGIELDSLADFLSFGVAPAVLVYSVKLNPGEMGMDHLHSLHHGGGVPAGAVQPDGGHGGEERFLGLPVPAAAITLVAYIIFSYRIWGQLEYSEWLVSMIILFAFLMVSQVQYDALPDHFDTKSARIKLALLVIAGAFTIFVPRLLLFPFLALYILQGYGPRTLPPGLCRGRPGDRTAKRFERRTTTLRQA